MKGSRKNDRQSKLEGEIMFDLIFVALTIVFFLLSLAYVRGCEKLQ
jgi:succinate-acetate transporter protein